VKAASLRLRDEKSGKGRNSGLGLELKRKDRGRVRCHFSSRGMALGAKAMSRSTRRFSGRNLKFDLAAERAGWGKSNCPRTKRQRTMSAWFAYAPSVPLHAAIVGEGASASRLRFRRRARQNAHRSHRGDLHGEPRVGGEVERRRARSVGVECA
jgi:hypothetical protein